MFFTTIQNPQVQMWQARLARVPRWGWIAFFVGVVLPIVVVGIGLLLTGLVFGFLILAAVMVLGFLIAGVRRLLRGRADDGRRNVQIMVHSARVIDP